MLSSASAVVTGNRPISKVSRAITSSHTFSAHGGGWSPTLAAEVTSSSKPTPLSRAPAGARVALMSHQQAPYWRACWWNGRALTAAVDLADVSMDSLEARWASSQPASSCAALTIDLANCSCPPCTGRPGSRPIKEALKNRATINGAPMPQWISAGCSGEIAVVQSFLNCSATRKLFGSDRCCCETCWRATARSPISHTVDLAAAQLRFDARVPNRS